MPYWDHKTRKQLPTAVAFLFCGPWTSIHRGTYPPGPLAQQAAPIRSSETAKQPKVCFFSWPFDIIENNAYIGGGDE